MENRVGFRFIPTDEEIVDHYIRLKNLGGSTNSHVDEAISTVDICSFDPWELPCKSRRESRDQVWYYFGRKDNRGERQSRKTKSGFWKKTGVTMDIFRKRGDREKIGEKRVLVYHLSGSKSKSDWVMHEYIATFLPPTTDQMTSYTVCKVMFKGDPSDLPSTSSSSGGEVEHMNNSGGSEVGLENPRHFTGLLDAEKETQIGDAIRRAIFDNVSTHDLNALLNFQNDDDELVNRLFMQEDRNDFRPKMSLTGFISDDDDDDDSDSDLISATTTTGSIQTSSSTYDSFGSSNRRIDQITDLKNSPSSTTKLMSPTQVVSKPLETSLDTSKETKNHYEDVQGTEMAKCEMDEKVINNKRAGFFYRKIQTCIKKILLCSSIPPKNMIIS